MDIDGESELIGRYWVYGITGNAKNNVTFMQESTTWVLVGIGLSSLLLFAHRAPPGVLNDTHQPN